MRACSACCVPVTGTPLESVLQLFKIQLQLKNEEQRFWGSNQGGKESKISVKGQETENGTGTGYKHTADDTDTRREGDIMTRNINN
jgi:hypothetical protein